MESPYIKFTDEELLAQYLQKDEAAFAALVERYQPPLFGYLYRLTGDRQTAEDLVQETLVRVVQHLWRYSSQYAFRTWLYAIATNLARNELRKRRRKVRVQTVAELPIQADTALQPWESLEQQESYARLLSWLDLLETEQRTVFVLRICEGLSYEEIIQIVGCKAATARRRLFYALENLRKWGEKFL